MTTPMDTMFCSYIKHTVVDLHAKFEVNLLLNSLRKAVVMVCHNKWKKEVKVDLLCSVYKPETQDLIHTTFEVYNKSILYATLESTLATCPIGKIKSKNNRAVPTMTAIFELIYDIGDALQTFW